jgi:uncharacterized membrane protein (UPF0127 family)
LVMYLMMVQYWKAARLRLKMRRLRRGEQNAIVSIPCVSTLRKMGKYTYIALLASGFGVVLVIGLAVYALVLTNSAADIEKTQGPQQAETFSYDQVILEYNGAQIVADVADTPRLQHQGLSGRRELPEGRGMWFVFDTPGLYGFWMPDMLISIDIIWLDEEFHVVTIKEHATPDSYPQLFYPTSPAKYVLEVPSGYARKIGLTEGSVVILAQ